MSSQGRPLAVRRLGRIGYARALALQESLLEARARGEVEDSLLLLEHDPVITLGRGAKPEHVLASRELLAAQGVELFETGRGGDVTYHGPGQLVGYPIIDLSPDRRDVRKYVAGLEEVMIRVAAGLGLTATRISGLNGAWIEDRKLGAVGVRIRRWVTMHGFALNVSTALDAFDLIVPCGIPDKRVTSLERELGRAPTMADVELAVVRAFCQVFDAAPAEATASFPA
ncbi:MAG: lipoyl(octanoyl) transferase LipB [Polyangiales bacterium]